MSLLDSFRAARWLRTLNFFLQGALVLTFVAGLNYLSLNHSWRFDLTESHRYSLSAETLANLRDQIKRPVQIVVTLPEDSNDETVQSALTDLRGLLREYAYATASTDGRITVKYLNVDQRLGEAEQLGVDQPNVVYVISGDRKRAITLPELYKVENGVPTAFLGEQAITEALLDVTSAERSHIYFLTGHQEERIDDVSGQGLSRLKDELKLRNFDVTTLNIMTQEPRRVPDDASLVIVAQAHQVEPEVQEQLRQYLSGVGRTRPGSMIVILQPGVKSGLDQLLLDDWGIDVSDDLICDTDPKSIDANGNIILRGFTRHPITETLIDYEIGLPIGPSRSIFYDFARATSGDLNVTTLAYTSTTAWGERDYSSGRPAVYNPGSDNHGNPMTQNRLGVVVASERTGAGSNLQFSVPRGRVIAIGGDLASNRLLSQPSLSFMLNAVSWAVNRDTVLNVPARPINRFQLTLDQRELVRLRYSLLFLVPGVTALFGLLVYWTRRS